MAHQNKGKPMALIADVVAGTVITVSWGNGMRDQVIATFADEATRDASIPTAPEGRYADCAGIDALTRGNGTTWDIVATKPLVASLASDASGITNNTTLADVSGLSIAVTANRVYEMHLLCLYTAGGGAGTGQFKMGFTGPAGATLDWGNIGLVVNGAGGVSGTATFDGSAIGDARSFGAGGSTTLTTMVAHGRLVTAGTAGDFKLQAAQVVSSGTATTVRRGTILRLWPIA